VRLRPAEIGEHAIAEVFGNVTFEPLDDGGSTAVVSGHHAAQVLGIEPCGELGRAHEIADQHGQLPAFGLKGSRRDSRRLRGCRRPSLVERCDGVEELAAVPDRCDADRG
jgi:hypothetical protein